MQKLLLGVQKQNFGKGKSGGDYFEMGLHVIGFLANDLVQATAEKHVQFGRKLVKNGDFFEFRYILYKMF